MPVAPARPPSDRVEPPSVRELDLAALLNLFDDDLERADRPDRAADDDVPSRAPTRRSLPDLRAWTRECRRRAAEWGMGPGGAWGAR